MFHQVHPLKLLTDWSTGLLGLYLLWQHRLAIGLIVILVPPAVASWLVIRYASLERQRESALGRYVGRSMTHAMELVRLSGFAVMAIAAWNRSVTFIVAGVVIVLFGWLRGLLMPNK